MMAASEAKDSSAAHEESEASSLIESDRQRLATDSAAWGRPLHGQPSQGSEPKEAAPSGLDAAETDTHRTSRHVAEQPAARRTEREIDAAGWGRLSGRSPNVEHPQISDRDAIRDAMVRDASERIDEALTDGGSRVADFERGVSVTTADKTDDQVAEQIESSGSSGERELTPPIGDADQELVQLRFTEDDLVHVGGGHSNGVFKVEIDSATVVYKPAQDEVPQRNGIATGEYWKHEVAAYQIDQMLGFELIPPTASINGPRGTGSIQQWVGERGLDAKAYTPQDQQMMGVLDYVLGSSDRHRENYRTQTDGRPSAIDNGLTLPSSDHDGMYSEFADAILHKPLHATIIAKVRSLDDSTFIDTLRHCGIGHESIDWSLARLHECQTGKIDGTAWHGLIFGRDFEQLV